MKHQVVELLERNDGFPYDYRMKCDCGGSSVLTAADYLAEVNQAHMQCEYCGRTIHFGRAVIALRDEHDPALDNQRVWQFTWYHTSTSEDWPSATYADRVAAQFQALAERLGDRLQGSIERESTTALHVGTYVAAVENMLRRMHNQADACSQFYLHRVTLEVDPARINEATGMRTKKRPLSRCGRPRRRRSRCDPLLECARGGRNAFAGGPPRVIRTARTLALPVRSWHSPCHPRWRPASPTGRAVGPHSWRRRSPGHTSILST